MFLKIITNWGWTMYLHKENKELFRDIISIVSERKNVTTDIVEKDYYVTMILYLLSQKEIEIIFKGGTSLSKAYGVIDRFSEDIDITFKEHLGESRRNNDDFLRMQTIKNTDNALFQCSSPDDAVINNNQIIHMRYQTTVSNIVHMGGQVIPAVAFGDKGTQLDILDGHFFATDTPGQDFFQFLVIGMMSQSLYLLYFQFIQIIVESFQQSIESHSSNS